MSSITVQEEVALWELVLTLKDATNAALERARADKVLGSPLEAQVLLHVSDPAVRATLAGLQGDDALRYSLIVSQVRVTARSALQVSTPVITRLTASIA